MHKIWTHLSTNNFKLASLKILWKAALMFLTSNINDITTASFNSKCWLFEDVNISDCVFTNFDVNHETMEKYVDLFWVKFDWKVRSGKSAWFDSIKGWSHNDTLYRVVRCEMLIADECLVCMGYFREQQDDDTARWGVKCWLADEWSGVMAAELLIGWHELPLAHTNTNWLSL